MNEPTIEVKKNGPAKQTHSVREGRAVIDEHGYRIKITVELDYNRLSNQQIPHAHNRIRSLIESALATSFALRGTNPAMIDVDDLELELEMDTDHA